MSSGRFNALNGNRAKDRSQLCWILNNFKPCHDRGTTWVFWTNSRPAVLACDQHVGDRRRVEPPEWAT